FMRVVEPLFGTCREMPLAAVVFETSASLQVIKFMIGTDAIVQNNINIVKKTGLDSVLQELAQNLDDQLHSQIYTRRHLRIYSGDAFFVVKPAQRRFWTKSAAINDADDTIRDLVRART